MFRKMLVLVAGLSLASCVGGEEIDSGESIESSKITPVQYQEFEGGGAPLFRTEVRAPVILMIGAGRGVTVMFGVDGATGQTHFAYFAPAERFSEMQEAGNREASLLVFDFANEGLPFGGGPIGPVGPGGGDFVPARVLLVAGGLAFATNRGQKVFADTFYEGGDR